jgi:hypothetical protein
MACTCRWGAGRRAGPPGVPRTLHQVYAGEELAAVQLVGEVKDAGEGVAVVCRRQVESAVVAAGPP